MRSELTLWAVDQGVLALTGFTTPDLLERIYQPRALGTGLWSTLPSILTAHPEMLAELASGFASLGSALNEVIVTQTGAGVMRVPSSLRSEFRSTAFFLASARTDDSGGAVLRAKLPDNLTTYGVMAVAVGTDDRFGSGDSSPNVVVFDREHFVDPGRAGRHSPARGAPLAAPIRPRVGFALRRRGGQCARRADAERPAHRGEPRYSCCR